MNPAGWQTYSTTALAPSLESLLARLGPADSHPPEQQLLAAELRGWVGRLLSQGPADLESKSWQAFGTAEYLSLIGERELLTVRRRAENIQRISIQRPDRLWTFEFLVAAPDQPVTLRVTIGRGLEPVSQLTFKADGTSHNERDWKAQIAGGLSQLRQALQKGESPGGMDLIQVAGQLGAAALASPALCPKCGSDLGPKDRFCTQCGTALAGRHRSVHSKGGSTIEPPDERCG